MRTIPEDYCMRAVWESMITLVVIAEVEFLKFGGLMPYLAFVQLELMLIGGNSVTPIPLTAL